MPIISMNEALPKINHLDHVLTEIYQKHVEEHENVNPVPLFRQYAEYTISAIRNEELGIVQKMLHVMEVLLHEGDDKVKHALKEGFLVHLDDKIHHIITSFEHFKKLMGPATHKIIHDYEDVMQRQLPLWKKPGRKPSQRKLVALPPTSALTSGFMRIKKCQTQINI